MKKILQIYFLVVFKVLFFTGCVSPMDVIYFNKDQINKELVNNDYQLTIKPDDMLQIIVSTDDLLSARPFNLPIISYTTDSNAFMGNPQLQSYLVDKNGFIDFPVIGKVKVGGLTRVEVISNLKTILEPKYLKNPIINIIISNFKITVTGDVKTPGSFRIPNERISIIDALGLAGDLNITANRTNVLVIRESLDDKKIFKVNLLSKNSFTSPVYYLQQNDIIYVEPKKARIQDSSYTRNTGLFISMASVLISLLTIITR